MLCRQMRQRPRAAFRLCWHAALALFQHLEDAADIEDAVVGVFQDVVALQDPIHVIENCVEIVLVGYRPKDLPNWLANQRHSLRPA